ncbi:TMV resistance protein N-like [Dorcoceras hygrometricum]|uniref:TMV resistance protein N-like n=1 Tax=Dorcoceras hygrometricum TaxID=472368 RepID=A0A2Z7DFC4_9LAMI|nr:TMV resistance protein N-like [Dorcoceras hygrometricum]
MGNTDPRHKSRKTKYEVKPQYEELSKQLNMQHAINQCYECMRLSKNRIARPVYQLAIQIKPPYHAQPISRWKSSVRDHRGPHDSSVGQSQRGTQSDFSKRHGNHTACGSRFLLALQFTAEGFLGLKSVTGINYKYKVQNDEECSPKSSKRLKAEAAQQNQQLTNTQKLSGYPHSLSMTSKLASIARANLKESSATKIVKNRGWKRRENGD